MTGAAGLPQRIWIPKKEYGLNFAPARQESGSRTADEIMMSSHQNLCTATLLVEADFRHSRH